MVTIFELLLPRRPVSLQAKRLQPWKAYVRAEAAQVWTTSPSDADAFRLTLVYLCNTSPVDIDNIIKPIQDALETVVYPADELITDVDSHRRLFTEPFDLTSLPILLIQGIAQQQECVYVRVQAGTAQPLQNYL
ncbi:RusA family crossover junction endodeoxyribonuclease [Hymenobacter negativus]|uniref:RusA family crossover junction endodeoxyribonuclease n=1 Tax=Hymenobacter negativus TaxID=2795026 RepID=A0ABS3QF66_9BACT|nr:RusA family crossover junction endodeoxyribonuclease [Hymenobacter negativus]MBO2009741.1 RusA family crossover junction endodeoxyribonuclease [Hymenobacter negativus]